MTTPRGTGGLAVDVDARLWPPRRPLADLRLRADARGCHGSVRRSVVEEFRFDAVCGLTFDHAAMALKGQRRRGCYRGDAGDAGAAPSRLRRPRDSERAVAGRRGGGATPTHCGCFAIAKSNVAGSEYQYGGGTWRRKSSSAASIAAMVRAA
jgi:hypothetical protein